MKTKFEIRDWANNLMFDGKEFDSFEEGWEFIYENIIEEYEGDGTYDDVYVLEKIVQDLFEHYEEMPNLVSN